MITNVAMITSEIPREEWNSFFDDFSKRHQGWIVTVEEAGSDIGEQEEATLLPFVGITADVKDGENRIAIVIGGQKSADLNRFIDMPERVWFRHTPQEQYDAIDVESKDGVKTILQFRFVPVEQVDRQLPESK
jgi:hypothetical protein